VASRVVCMAMPSHDHLPAGRELAPVVWHRLRPYHKRIGGSLLLLLISVPLTNFHPLVWGIVADALMQGTLTARSLGAWLAVMGVTYTLGLVAGAFHTYLMEKTGQAFVRDIRKSLFEKFEGQSLAYHRRTSSGELVTRMTSDVDAMEQSVLQGLTGLVEEVVTFIVVAAMVLWISPLVGGASILPLAVAFIFIRIYNRRVKRIYDGVRKRLGHIGSFVQDRLAGVQVTQSFVREAAENQAFAAQADQFYQVSVEASRIRNRYFPVVSLLGFVNNLVMLGVGGWLIMQGSGAFTIGALLAYRGFWWRLQSPIRTIAQTTDILQRARAAAARVVELLHAPVAVTDQEHAGDWTKRLGEVEFRDVEFSYDSGPEILRKVSFRVKAGEFVAIAGGSGSGKSTLLNLIPRFFDATGGLILIDGKPVKSIKLDSLRAGIAWVGQDSYLFDASVRENIRYARPEASDVDVIEAARAANAHDFIIGLGDGYDTQVGQNGARLSGGQRQRISLARAFLARPTLLLLDEPTASVEPESEALIHDSILRRSAAEEGTTLLVTHRLDLLRQAPRILFFADGVLSGDGSHEELIEICPAYVDAYQRWQVEENTTAMECGGKRSATPL